MLNHIFIIAKNTFRETMRDRILIAAVVLVFTMIGFSIFIASISIDQDIRMIIDFSLTVIYILQLFIAIFIGSMLMYKEMERRTFFLILPKPIKLDSIILGKCLGLTATTILVSSIATIALFGILFSAGELHLYALPILWSIVFSLLEVPILILISILFSGITSPILAAIYTVGLYCIGHSSEIMRTIMAETTSQIKIYILQVAYYILPNLEKFNLRNDVIYGRVPSITIIILTTLYAITCMLLIFVIARSNLKRKEF